VAWDPFDGLDNEFFDLVNEEGGGWATAPE
jgi:hypothetical protein